MRRGLTATILGRMVLWLLLHLLLLAGVALCLLFWQFRNGLDDLLRGSAGDRLRAVGERTGSELRSLRPTNWKEPLMRFAAMHDLQVDVFMPDDRWALQEFSEVPPEVKQRLLADPGRRPQPPPRAEMGRAPQRFAEESEDSLLDEEPPRGPVELRQVLAGGPSRPLFLLRDPRGDGFWAAVDFAFVGKGPPARAVMVMKSQSWHGVGLFVDLKPWILGGSGMLILSVLFWLPFAWHMTRYLRLMSAATAKIAEGNFEVSLPRRADELGQLGESLIGMAGRIDALMRGQKRFLGDVAHELCSPLARMRTALGILELRLPEAERHRLDDLDREAAELAALIEEILAFSRSAVAVQQLSLQQVNVADLLTECLKRESPQARVELQVAADLHWVTESRLLHRALCNVLRNVTRHAGLHAAVRVQAVCESGRLCITIADSGPGVAEQELEHLFDPFYRADSSRQRETGGVGLGLSIVRHCVSALQGTVSARNAPEGGLVVRFELPKLDSRES